VTIVNIRHRSGFREDQLMIAVAPQRAPWLPSWNSHGGMLLLLRAGGVAARVLGIAGRT
jgi:hypothetical protein